MDNNTKTNQADEFNLKMLLAYFFIYWKWFLFSVIFCLIGAYAYLRYADRKYSVSAKIIMQDKKKGTFDSQLDVLKDFGFQNSNTSVENEIEVLKSKSIIEMAVLEAKLYMNYFVCGSFSTQPSYYAKMPILADMREIDLRDLRAVINLELTKGTDSTYKVSYNYKNSTEEIDIKSNEEVITTFPYLLSTVKGDVLLTENPKGTFVDKYIIKINPLNSTVNYYKGIVNVMPISKTASVSSISMFHNVPQQGIDFVNTLVRSYNKSTNDDKNLVGEKTKFFIKERIDTIGRELSKRDASFLKYKQENKLTDPLLEAPQILLNESSYGAKLAEVESYLKQVQFFIDFVNEPSNYLQVIPTSIGLSDPSLTALLSNYNFEVASRNKLLMSATESNPKLLQATQNVVQMYGNIKDALLAHIKTLVIQKTALTKQTDKYEGKISKSPTIERDLTNIARERDIKQALYVMLLQKSEENALAIAITADNAKLIDPASVSNVPISPKPNIVWLLALIIGLAIPALIIYLTEMLRDKIEGRSDLEKQTTLPILGDVPLKHELSGKRRTIVVEANKNDMMAEIFRAIRTNLQFVMKNAKGKVIMFTSTTSGEGKTFISCNLAVSTALLGKKVIIIGLDVRKPRLAELFKLPNKSLGITTYLAADENDVNLLDTQIIKSGIENLDILTAGIIPPNPAELLSRRNLESAIEHLSKKYDYVILDTAPVGLVTDSIIISRVADAVVYVCRADYTSKNDIKFVNSLVEEGKLTNMSLIINAVDMKKKKYGYYYGYGKYGYGRRHGYGYGYTTED